ncbi:MAG TPA: hypothetical protein VFE37_03005 [Chloroflexota bacterium]|nr:hypothetical protein [Chloroflexota bacterium]
MSDPPSEDADRQSDNTPGETPPDEAQPDTAASPAEGSEAADTAAALGASGVRVVYTDTLPEGVYVVYRGGPPRLLVNEAWWRRARPVERIQALESLWARLQSIPPESWDSLEQP